jgi:site-specific DNA-methyltransferase (adenine-specific)
MELMARYPDNYFDLAIVDPPYGIGVTKMTLGSAKKKLQSKEKDWDNEVPNEAYFKELFRVSKNQLIWGGNYFNLPSSRFWIVWDKNNGESDFADGEMCWGSFDKPMRIKRVNWCGSACKHETGQNKIHPTQKPIKIYEWQLMNYGDIECEKCNGKGYTKTSDCVTCNTLGTRNAKILDTHLGSGSIALACHNLGFELTACELDKEYYDASIKRIENHVSQIRMF